jgi:hypothetical protein
MVLYQQPPPRAAEVERASTEACAMVELGAHHARKPPPTGVAGEDQGLEVRLMDEHMWPLVS